MTKDLQAEAIRKKIVVDQLKLLKELEARRRNRSIDFYKPYKKQLEFHDAGLHMRERLLMAGNQNGKTFCGGAEVSYHLTGEYPDWWMGRRWDRPTRCWVAGITGESTRDNPQRILLGTTADIMANGPGTGLIPKHTLSKDNMTSARGVSDLYDTVLVKHISGGMSEMKFKSYERGRAKWQGDTLDFLWFDEEPPEDIYAEGMARIIATNGMVFVTFTPLQGMSEVVSRFLHPTPDDEGAKDRCVTTMTIDDAEHIPAEQRAKIVASFLPHEREARRNGIPMLGSGKVFQTLEENFVVDPFPIPPHWKLIWGFDFGLDHPFAAALHAWDVDNDCLYCIHEVRMSDTMPLQHVAAMKAAKGWEAPVAWPQDGHIRREFGGDLVATAMVYKKHGLKMLPHHATFEDGGNSTEAGILHMQERLSTNRYKVFRTCQLWLGEYRMYHRKDGEIVKLRDDLLSASRNAVIQRRSARAVLFYEGQEQQKQSFAKGLDFDVFNPHGDSY